MFLHFFLFGASFRPRWQKSHASSGCADSVSGGKVHCYFSSPSPLPHPPPLSPLSSHWTGQQQYPYYYSIQHNQQSLLANNQELFDGCLFTDYGIQPDFLVNNQELVDRYLITDGIQFNLLRWLFAAVASSKVYCCIFYMSPSSATVSLRVLLEIFPLMDFFRKILDTAIIINLMVQKKVWKNYLVLHSHDTTRMVKVLIRCFCTIFWNHNKNKLKELTRALVASNADFSKIS